MPRRNQTTLIVIHCSATRPAQDIGFRELTEMHRVRGIVPVGYHRIIRRDGTVEDGRPLDDVGAHVKGHNFESVGVCMVGGLDAEGRELNDNPEQFTDAQHAALRVVVQRLRDRYPGARVVGHRDLSPDVDGDGMVERHEWLKTCPGFDVARQFPV